MGFKSERLYGGGDSSQNKVVKGVHFIVKSLNEKLVVVGLVGASRVFDLTIDFSNFSYEITCLKYLALSKEQLVFLDRALIKEYAYRNIYFSNVEIFYDFMKVSTQSEETQVITSPLSLV